MPKKLDSVIRAQVESAFPELGTIPEPEDSQAFDAYLAALRARGELTQADVLLDAVHVINEADVQQQQAQLASGRDRRNRAARRILNSNDSDEGEGLDKRRVAIFFVTGILVLGVVMVSVMNATQNRGGQTITVNQEEAPEEVPAPPEDLLGGATDVPSSPSPSGENGPVDPLAPPGTTEPTGNAPDIDLTPTSPTAPVPEFLPPPTYNAPEISTTPVSTPVTSPPITVRPSEPAAPVVITSARPTATPVAMTPAAPLPSVPVPVPSAPSLPVVRGADQPSTGPSVPAPEPVAVVTAVRSGDDTPVSASGGVQPVRKAPASEPAASGSRLRLTQNSSGPGAAAQRAAETPAPARTDTGVNASGNVQLGGGAGSAQPVAGSARLIPPGRDVPRTESSRIEARSAVAAQSGVSGQDVLSTLNAPVSATGGPSSRIYRRDTPAASAATPAGTPVSAPVSAEPTLPPAPMSRYQTGQTVPVTLAYDVIATTGGVSLPGGASGSPVFLKADDGALFVGRPSVSGERMIIVIERMIVDGAAQQVKGTLIGPDGAAGLPTTLSKDGAAQFAQAAKTIGGRALDGALASLEGYVKQLTTPDSVVVYRPDGTVQQVQTSNQRTDLLTTLVGTLAGSFRGNAAPQTSSVTPVVSARAPAGIKGVIIFDVD